jgi:PAS domain S-box-containing protein
MGNESLYRILFEQSKEATAVVGEDGKFININKAFLDLLGYNKSELMKLNARNIWADPADRVLWQAEMARKGSVVDYQCRYLRKDGTVRDSTISSTKQYMEDGTIFYQTICHDVTERLRAEEAIRSAYDKLEQNVEERTAELVNANLKLKKEMEERERAEAALKESELKYRTLSEGSLTGISIHQDDKYVYVNDIFAKMHGYTPEELIGRKKHYELIHPDQRETIKERSFKRLRGEEVPKRYEIKRLTKDGQVVWHEIIVSDPITYQGKPAVMGHEIDITERKLAEEALRESEERYKNVVDSSLSAIVLYRQEEILFANKPFYDIFEYEPEDLENLVVNDLLAPEAAAEVEDRRRRRMAGEIDQAAVYESKGKRKNGETFDMEISVCATHYLGESCCIASLSDISERKRSDEARRESESRFRTLFDLSPQPVAVVEMETGRLIDVNDKYCELMQYDKTELIGRNTIDLGLLSKADRDLYLDRMRRTGEVWDMEIDYTVKDGSVINILVFSKLIRISGQDLTVTVLFDITERKWLESQLQQAHKMEAVGTLAGGIAHDFNNILGIIIGNAELAIDDVPEWNPARHNLEEVRKACIRARDVVRQILTFSRQASPQLKPVKITPIITESLNLIRSSIPSTIEIRQNISNERDTVNANPTQINQILLNLCANAAHAMEEKGGIIEVDLENVILHEESAIPSPELDPGVYVKLTVRDTGHGISPETLDRIFDPYFTTKAVGKGTGMGLAVAHASVKNHGGVITVASKIDEGTTFQVFFPVYDIEVETDIETDEKLPKGNERILLVDDEEGMVETIRLLLERLGYAVTDRAGSVEALKEFRNNPKAYDLVVTDMTMPHMTGDQLAKEILGIRPDIPVILCTGFSERINNQVAKDMGIRELLIKPIMLGKLANTIRRVLDGK